MFDLLLNEFGLDSDDGIVITSIHQGLINNTWKIRVKGKHYILQRVNDEVFKYPEDIAFNIAAISDYLQTNRPDYFFVSPLKISGGKSMVYDAEGGYYRAFPYVEGSHSLNVVQTTDEAYEAAKQFGQFTAALKDFDTSFLKVTIPSFHDLSLRYSQFLRAVEQANEHRKAASMAVIVQLQSWVNIVDNYERVKRNPKFKQRVMHHDTKISNVLFDNAGKGICVIDLDTVMPGYFISDVGDMMRTYLSPVSEEENDLERVTVRREFYEAIVAGYSSKMGGELTRDEKNSFFYAGLFMIYMQALRFLTDYLQGDLYYKSAYPEHNLIRAKNQATLLQRFLEMQFKLTHQKTLDIRS